MKHASGQLHLCIAWLLYTDNDANNGNNNNKKRIDKWNIFLPMMMIGCESAFSSSSSSC
jgi:hypothetical protein